MRLFIKKERDGESIRSSFPSPLPCLCPSVYSSTKNFNNQPLLFYRKMEYSKRIKKSQTSTLVIYQRTIQIRVENIVR